MPIVKVGKQWEFNGTTYKTEEEAENAYRATVALKFGVPEETKKTKKKKETEDEE